MKKFLLWFFCLLAATILSTAVAGLVRGDRQYFSEAEARTNSRIVGVAAFVIYTIAISTAIAGTKSINEKRKSKNVQNTQTDQEEKPRFGMDDTLFQEIARYGFKSVDPKICVGIWKNYAVALNNYAGKAYYFYAAIRIPKGSPELLKAVAAAFKAAELKNAAVMQAGPNCIQGIFTQPKEDLGGCFTRFLDTLTGTLAQNGVAPANTCAVTGAPNPDSLCFMMNGTFQGYQPVCGAAVRQSGYEAQARVEENENNGSYLTGLIGALLGMLAGVAVNLLTIVFLQRYFAMLFALIPVAAMFGYKLFKGKLDKVSIVIVIALSVIAVPLMEYLSLVLGVSREFDIPVGIAMQATMEALQNPDVKKDIISDILMMLLFMGIGVFIAFSFLRGQLNSTKSGSSQMVLNSMRPNPLYAAPAQSYAEPEAPIAPAAPAEPVESQE